jgi:uncharacterized protein YceK
MQKCDQQLVVIAVSWMLVLSGCAPIRPATHYNAGIAVTHSSGNDQLEAERIFLHLIQPT